jgi:hypothetical protein
VADLRLEETGYGSQGGQRYEINAIPPMMPPAMTPTWLPECEGVGGAVNDALAEGVEGKV